jgi:glycosyltransferase involved in cell wall biosynthesis
VTLIVHEPFTPWYARPDLALGAALLRLQLGAVLRSCAHVFVTTGSRYRLLENAMAALSPRRGYDIMRIGPNALPIARTPSASGHRVGLFSTLAVGKRFDVVIEAFEAIARVYPDAELKLIGDLGRAGGPARRAFEARLAHSDVVDRIAVSGKLSLSEIAAAVAGLDLYLFPMDTGANTRSGTLPVALGAGVPVIATAGAETDPVFVNRDNVLFARDLTGPGFAEAALEVLGDRGLSDQLSRGGRDLYEQQLSWPRITDAFLQAIA